MNRKAGFLTKRIDSHNKSNRIDSNRELECSSAGVVICLERGADLYMAELMPLPLTVSCFSKIQIGFTFLVPAHMGSPEKGPLNERMCVLRNRMLLT